MVIFMGLTPQQALCTKYIYYAVFNDDLTEYYGLTSEEDKEIIEKYLLTNLFSKKLICMKSILIVSYWKIV